MEPKTVTCYLIEQNGEAVDVFSTLEEAKRNYPNDQIIMVKKRYEPHYGTLLLVHKESIKL